MKKLLSMMAIFVLLTTQVGTATPAYAASTLYDTATKVADSTRLSGVYNYQLSIQDGKLIATGKYARSADSTKYNVEMQITKPVTYANWYVGNDGIARVDGNKTPIKVGQGWELKTTIPVVRSTTIKGANTISIEIDLSGLSDGIYPLQEIVSQGSIQEGHYCDSTLLVVHNGTASLQTTWIYAHLTSWWHDPGFYIS